MAAYHGGAAAAISTELIQKYLDENKQLILAILDNQNLGKLNECAQYQLKLQQNLMYLAAIADSQPQPMPAQVPATMLQQQQQHHQQQQHQQQQQYLQQQQQQYLQSQMLGQRNLQYMQTQAMHAMASPAGMPHHQPHQQPQQQPQQPQAPPQQAQAPQGHMGHASAAEAGNNGSTFADFGQRGADHGLHLGAGSAAADDAEPYLKAPEEDN